MNSIRFLRISQITWIIAAAFSLFCIVWYQIKMPGTWAWYFLIVLIVSLIMIYFRTRQIKKLKKKNG